MIKSCVVLILVFAVLAFVAACAQTFTGRCAVQPIAAQEKIVFVNVHCEGAE